MLHLQSCQPHSKSHGTEKTSSLPRVPAFVHQQPPLGNNRRLYVLYPLSTHYDIVCSAFGAVQTVL